MQTRRAFLAALIAGAAATLSWTPTGSPAASPAAQPTVEIVALSHWPVQNALKPLRAFLTKLDGKVRVIELDAESPAGEKRIGALGLKGHIPVVLVINGSYRFKRPDGTAVEFKDFPAKAANPAGLNGAWTEADFEAAVGVELGKQGKQP
jgi:hypothetical protein